MENWVRGVPVFDWATLEASYSPRAGRCQYSAVLCYVIKENTRITRAIAREFIPYFPAAFAPGIESPPPRQRVRGTLVDGQNQILLVFLLPNLALTHV